VFDGGKGLFWIFVFCQKREQSGNIILSIYYWHMFLFHGEKTIFELEKKIWTKHFTKKKIMASKKQRGQKTF
jgi:hypothetical protein